MTILVIGATGTLGRQIVKELLNYGFKVNCLVRNFKKANFLQEWGANIKYGDLKLVETITYNLKGINIVIDCSSFRLDDEITVLQEIDLLGKIALIKASKISKIKKFIFFSLKETKNYEHIPLIKLKKKIEKILRNSKLNYSIFKLDSFYQGIINQYAIPLLEQQSILISKNENLNFYINTQDIAKIFIKFFVLDTFLFSRKNSIIEINGPKLWNSNMIIKLSEELIGQQAKIENISQILFQIIKQFLTYTKWSSSIYDRLTFVEFNVMNKKNQLEEKLKFTNLVLYINKQDLTFLDSYLEEYFEMMLKKLKDLNYDQNQILKRKNLIF